MMSRRTSDPYVKFKCGGRLIYKSKTVYRDLNPIWDESFTTPIEDPFVPVQIKVFDYDWGLQDDFMGAATLDLTSLELGKTLDLTLALQDPSSASSQLGEVMIAVTLYPKSQEDKEQESKKTYQINRLIDAASNCLPLKVVNCKINEKMSAYASYLRQKPSSRSSAQSKKKYYFADDLVFLTPFTKCRQQKSSIPSSTNVNEETSISTHEEATEREPPESEVQDENYENERVLEESTIDESLLVFESSLTGNKVSHGKYKEVDPLEKYAIDYFTSKKRTQQETSENHELLFLKSILPDFRQMTNVQKHELK
ncbi:hypothetical protein FQA39_LY13400 [Lamprigera yunnana]|nr:hypothetical protein FQA39_LY13400 [Lamprigera yunnana]